MFQVETALTPLEKQTGLSERDSLPSGTGMLFLYDEEGVRSFWMRGMRFPLDFVWIKADCTVLETTLNVPPPEQGTPTSSLPLYLPSQPILHVLEVNAGEAQGIRPGDQVRFSGEELAGYAC